MLKEIEIKQIPYKYDPDTYWKSVFESYPYYPTIRHRIRFIISSIRKFVKKQNISVFDFGVGDGSLLSRIKDEFHIQESNLGGCDISSTAVDITKGKIKSKFLFKEQFPVMEKKWDVIVCCEVLEHTRDYINIIKWIKKNLSDDGILILTTQTGKLYGSDKYTGHTQHFNPGVLKEELLSEEFKLLHLSLWGFPFFSLQKWLTSFNFSSIRDNYMEGKITLFKRVVFELAYCIYFIHDFINAGPQIFIVAKKKD